MPTNKTHNKRFCDNEKCNYNKTDYGRNQGAIRVKQRGILCEIRNHNYIDSNGVEVKLCDVCHAAVSLIKKP